MDKNESYNRKKVQTLLGIKDEKNYTRTLLVKVGTFQSGSLPFLF